MNVGIVRNQRHFRCYDGGIGAWDCRNQQHVLAICAVDSRRLCCPILEIHNDLSVDDLDLESAIALSDFNAIVPVLVGACQMPVLPF